MAILGTIFFPILSYFPAEGHRSQAFQRISESARGSLWPLAIVALLLTWATTWLLMFLQSRCERFSWCKAWLLKQETKIGDIVLWIPMLVFLAGVLWNVLLVLEIPGTRRLPVVQATVVKTENLSWIFDATRSIDLPEDRGILAAREGDHYVMAVDNVLVVQPNGWRGRLFAEPVPALTDILPLSDMLLAVSEQTLIRTTKGGRAEKVADLPGPGFRFGQRWKSNHVILFGQAEGKGMVFELTPDGEYLKTAQVDGLVTAAAGLNRQTVVATGSVLTLLAPGRDPRILFETPPNMGAITSVLAREDSSGKALYLIATSDMVFGLQEGIAHTLLAGLGGELRFESADWRWIHLMDARRNVALKFVIPSE